jgi:predicted extracellular nuclease
MGMKHVVAAGLSALVLVAPLAIASQAGAAGTWNVAASSPLSLGAAGCVESFDGLAAGNGATSLPPGAAFYESGTSSAADGSYAAGDGSSNAGDVYSYGSSAGTDRAFGTLLSSSLTPILGVVVRNDTDTTITSLGVAYRLEQWRLGSTGRNDQLTFSYSTSTTALTGGTYTSVTALNGNGPLSSGTVGLRDGNATGNLANVSGSITGLSVAPGGTLLLRWVDLNATGSDDGLAIDDLTLTPNGAATPTALCSVPSTGGSGVTRIHDIQGNGATSPLAGQSRTVSAIVVGVDDQVGASFGTGNSINTYPTDRGFFLQEADADADGDPATSEGIFVGLSSAATALPGLGDRVTLAGTIRDGQSAPAFGQTRIETSSYTVVSSGNPLPTVTVIDPTSASGQTIGAETNPTRSYYETLEGMRVRLATGRARSGGTNKFGETFLVPGTTGGTLLRTDPVQPGLLGTLADAGAGNPANPYYPSQRSTTLLGVDQGDTVSDLTGPLAYTYGNYKVVTQVGQLPTITKTGVTYPYAALTPAGSNQRRIVSFNVENFFPEGGALDGTIVSAADFALKRDQIADAIGRLLLAPDVVAVQEIGDNQHLGQSGATTSLGTLQSLAARLGALGYGSYTAYALEGNDNRGIDVGFLVKDTVTVIGAADQRGGLTAAGSCSDVSGRLFDRPPLFLKVDPGAGIAPLWVVSNHFASKSAPDSCRVAQATWLRDQVKTLTDAGERVAVTGDLNAFEDEGALTTLTGAPSTLSNLWGTVPRDRAYSYHFGGVLQTLDHLLVSTGLQGDVAAFTYAHLDNDYYLRATQPDGHKVSDHDPPVLTLSPGGAPAPVVPEAGLPWLLVLSGLGVMLAAAFTQLRRQRSAPAGRA